MISKLLAITVFITNWDKKTLNTLFLVFEKITNRETFRNFKIIITNCDKNYYKK